MKPVLILGSGPAGLMAAHACKITGVPFTVVTQGGADGAHRSKIGGAQFVHNAVPGVMDTEPEGKLTYHVVGEETGYKHKVYGLSEVPFVSVRNVRDGQVVGVWSIQRAYDRLWDDIAGGGSSLHLGNVTPEWLADEIESGRWAHIVSTIPKTAVCIARAGYGDKPHSFVSQAIKIANECMLNYDSTESHIWYDGTQNVSWYRTSQIFGVGSTEWGNDFAERNLPYKTVPVRKPVSTDCTCFMGKVLFTGRFGAWRKGLLVHHAFSDTWKLLHPNRDVQLTGEVGFDVVQ